MTGDAAVRLWRGRLVALVVAPAPVIVALLLAAAGTPGYSHLAETVSALGAPGRARAALARCALVLYGAVALVAAGPLGARCAPRPRALAWSVRIYGLGAVVAGLSPKVLPGQEPTTASHVHVVAALAGGAALLVAMYLVAHGGVRPVERRVAAAALAVVAVASVVFQRTWGTALYGLVERVVLGTGVAWLSWAAWCELAATRVEVSPRR